MKADKIKVLFIVSEFWQAGGERQAYEFNSSFNKNKFQIDLFCLLPLNIDKNKEDFYYSKHLELDSNIHFWDSFKVKNVKFSRLKSVNRITKEKNEATESNLKDFFKSYDFFLFFGEYTYGSFYNSFSKEYKSWCIVLIHNSRFQVPNNYTRFDKSDCIHFLSGFLEDEIKHELAEFDRYEHTCVPLSINCEFDFPKRKKKESNNIKKKIGLFTRLTIHKPLDVFYFALHLLRERGNDVELLVFGNGKPEDYEFNKCINYLGLSESIFFMGHQKEILKSAVENELDLVWFHSYYGVPGGYASFDICMTQIPQVFWDFTPGKINPYYPEFRSFNSLDGFVDYTQKLLSSEDVIEEIGRKQMEAIKLYRNLNSEIKKVEILIQEKVNDKQSLK
jgi:glycosyltransferase involved in cell wall biosynthesis